MCSIYNLFDERLIISVYHGRKIKIKKEKCCVGDKLAFLHLFEMFSLFLNFNQTKKNQVMFTPADVMSLRSRFFIMLKMKYSIVKLYKSILNIC